MTLSDYEPPPVRPEVALILRHWVAADLLTPAQVEFDPGWEELAAVAVNALPDVTEQARFWDDLPGQSPLRWWQYRRRRARQRYNELVMTWARHQGQHSFCHACDEVNAARYEATWTCERCHARQRGFGA